MKIGIFTPGDLNKDHDAVLQAFAEGVRKCSMSNEVFVESHNNYRNCDVAAVFGTFKRKVEMSWHRGEIIQLHKNLSKPVVIIDTGYVKRDKYFCIGLNGLNGEAEFKNKLSPDARWKELNVALHPWKRATAPSDKIYVCGQIPWDATVQDFDNPGWCRYTTAMLKLNSIHPVEFRPHPLLPEGRGQRPLQELPFTGTHAVVTFNGTSAVEAVIAGIPAFVANKGSMAWDVANTDISLIDAPIFPDRTQWANNLAYTQWNIDEIREGKPWRHLFR